MNGSSRGSSSFVSSRDENGVDESLPRWAKVAPFRPPSTERDDDDDVPRSSDGGDIPGYRAPSTEEIAHEDHCLRVDACRSVRRIVDAALDEAFASSTSDGTILERRRRRRRGEGRSGGLVEDVSRFFDAFRPSTSSSSSTFAAAAEVDGRLREGGDAAGGEDGRPAGGRRAKRPHGGEAIGVGGEAAPKRKRATTTEADDDDGSGPSADDEEEEEHGDASFLGATMPRTTPRRYPSSILPVAFVRCPPSILDRTAIADHLCRNLRRGCGGFAAADLASSGREESGGLERRRRATTKASVCLIRNGCGPEGRLRSHGDLMREVVTQCLSQEPNPSRFGHLLERKRTKGGKYRPLRYVESLRDWREETTTHDSLIVVLENPETLSSPTLEAFLGTLTSLRCGRKNVTDDNCFPVSVAFLTAGSIGGSDALSDVSASYYGNVGGVMERHFCMPSSDVLYDRAMESLFLDIGGNATSLPVLLSGATLRSIRQTFENHHRSVVSAVRSIQTALAHRFAEPGSFLDAIDCPKFRRRHWQRVAWFCVDRRARSLTFPPLPTRRDAVDKRLNAVAGKRGSGAMKRRRKRSIERRFLLSLVCDAVRTWHGRLPSSAHSYLPARLLIESCLTRSPDFRGAVRDMLDATIESSPRAVLSLLVVWRDVVRVRIEEYREVRRRSALFDRYAGTGLDDDEEETTMPAFLREWTDGLNELIVLLGTTIVASKDDDDDGDGSSSAGRDLKEGVLHLIESFVLRSFLAKRDIDADEEDDNDDEAAVANGEASFRRSNSAEPRRSVANAIADPQCTLGMSDVDLQLMTKSSGFEPTAAFRAMELHEMTTSQWFGKYLERVRAARRGEEGSGFDNGKQDDGKEGEDDWTTFAFAVYSLAHCGLVRRKTSGASGKRGGGRPDDVFEKVAVAWSSGEA